MVNIGFGIGDKSTGYGAMVTMRKAIFTDVGVPLITISNTICVQNKSSDKGFSLTAKEPSATQSEGKTNAC